MFCEWATAAGKESGLGRGTALTFVQGCPSSQSPSIRVLCPLRSGWCWASSTLSLPCSCSIPCLCQAHLLTDACSCRTALPISALGLSCLPGFMSSPLSPPSLLVPPPPEALPACSWPWLAVLPPLFSFVLCPSQSMRWPLLAEALITDPAFLWAERLLESRDVSSWADAGLAQGIAQRLHLRGTG